MDTPTVPKLSPDPVPMEALLATLGLDAILAANRLPEDQRRTFLESQYAQAQLARQSALATRSAVAPEAPVGAVGLDAIWAGDCDFEEQQRRLVERMIAQAKVTSPGPWLQPQRPPKPTLPPGRLILGPNFKHHTPHHVGTIGLRLGTRRFTAIATCADGERPTVLHLELQPSTGQRIAQTLAGFLPRIVRAWLFSLLPEWNLPTRMVLKAQKIPWYDEFDLEKATYARLRPLQGTVIPELLGEVSYRGNRALLMSDIGGASAGSAEGCLMPVADFERAVRECMAAVNAFGVSQDDIRLDNYHVVGDKVMAVDFEMVSDRNRRHRSIHEAQDIPEEEQKRWDESNVKRITDYFREQQLSWWRQGIIAVEGVATELDAWGMVTTVRASEPQC